MSNIHTAIANLAIALSLTTVGPAVAGSPPGCAPGIAAVVVSIEVVGETDTLGTKHEHLELFAESDVKDGFRVGPGELWRGFNLKSTLSD